MVGRLRHANKEGGRIASAGMIASLVLLAACHAGAVARETRPLVRKSSVATVWPLRFVQYNFGAHCFDTIGCRITYAGFVHGADRADEISPPMASYKGSRDQLLRAGHIGKRSFPAPAKVAWRSKDGVPHEAEVDLDLIFKDRVVQHNVLREDYREDLGIADPDIVLEVNDRTISIYMRALVPTKTEHTSGSSHRYSREDLILVSSRTY